MTPLLKFLPNPCGECVPDGYRYTFPQDGYRAEAITYGDWKEAIEKHYAQNGYPREANYMALAEDQLCQLLPPGWCIYDNGSRPTAYINPRFGIMDVVRGTEVMASWTLNGSEVVDAKEAERRADICSKCYFNMPVEGCGPCHALANVVASVNGAKTTKSEQLLRICAVCKCSNKAQVWVPIEHLEKGVTPQMMEQFPSFCWKRQQTEDYRATKS